MCGCFSWITLSKCNTGGVLVEGIIEIERRRDARRVPRIKVVAYGLAVSESEVANLPVSSEMSLLVLSCVGDDIDPKA